MRLVRFRDVGLAYASTDREVWRFAQSREMILLTNNRNMEGSDSLEQTIREEGSSSALPVLTIGRIDRITERAYRESCAERLLEIMVYLDDYRGVGRLFLP
jgi:predicted nuclease of predicted toxin-antitoxin system